MKPHWTAPDAGAPLKTRLKAFWTDTKGSVLDTVLVVGVISLPLITFLAVFGNDVVKWVKKHAPDIFNEASSWLGG